MWGCVLFSLACSDGGLRAASIDPSSRASLADEDGEGPSLILRCEEGRVNAYVLMDMPAEADSGSIDDGAVEVQLDSAPACSGAAP
jgi:hypothetical protein